MSARADGVRGLLESDALALQPGFAETATGRINDLGAIVRWQTGQYVAGQHVAAIDSLVLEDTVIKQVHGAAMVNAQEWGLGRNPILRQRLAGFGEINVPRQIGETDDGLVNSAVLVK